MRADPVAGVMRHPVTRRTLLLSTLAGMATTGCADTLERPPARLRLATGPPGAVYREVGGALAEVLDRRLTRTEVIALPTDASVENLTLLSDKGTELAIAQLDATVAGLASGVPDTVTAVARLFDSWLHLVVHAGSPVDGLRDLDGATLAVGAPRSGTQFTVARLLRLVPDVKPRLVNLTQAEEVEAFRAGRVDAFFTLTGVPTPAVSALARQVPIRLVPLPGCAAGLNERYGGTYPAYRSATIPASAYPGVSATETVTVANLLLARPGLEPDLVELVAAMLFAERARIARGHPEARSINRRTGIATGPIPLHRGAVRYYRAQKR